MTDKITSTPRQARFRKSVRQHVLFAVLLFLIFVGFDLADGDPDGLRGLGEFLQLLIGA